MVYFASWIKSYFAFFGLVEHDWLKWSRDRYYTKRDSTLAQCSPTGVRGALTRPGNPQAWREIAEPVVYDSSNENVSIVYVSVIIFGVPPEQNWVAKCGSAQIRLETTLLVFRVVMQPLFLAM